MYSLLQKLEADASVRSNKQAPRLVDIRVVLALYFAGMTLKVSTTTFMCGQYSVVRRRTWESFRANRPLEGLRAISSREGGTPTKEASGAQSVVSSATEGIFGGGAGRQKLTRELSRESKPTGFRGSFFKIYSAVHWRVRGGW